MNEDQIKEFLRENLKIRTKTSSGYYGGTEVEIMLIIKDEVISTDEFYIPPERYDP